MKKNNIHFVIFILLFLFCLPLVSHAQKPIELTFATAFSQHRDHEKGTLMFVDMLKKYAGNRIKIINKGGPESIPAFELIEAVRTGIVDFAEDPAGYYSAQIPEANGMRLSTLHPWEERVNGAYDLFRKVAAEKGNIYFLGKIHAGAKFEIYSNKKVVTTADFKGMKIRSTPTYRDFLIALGATPVTMPHSEIYTALDRGVVDGVCTPAFGVTEKGWHEKIKYLIRPRFYQQDQTIIFNLDTWNKLPKDLQKLIDDIMVTIEKDSMEFILKRVKANRDDMIKAGLKEITLKDSDRFLEIAKEAGWASVLKKSDPKYGPQLKKLWSYSRNELK